MSCITYHLESFLRDEARALAGQGMSLADRPASTHTPTEDPADAKLAQNVWARALTAWGIFPANEPDTQTAPTPPSAALQPGAGRTSSLGSSQVAPSSFDPAFFEAWRESQGQPVDALPRVGA